MKAESIYKKAYFAEEMQEFENSLLLNLFIEHRRVHAVLSTTRLNITAGPIVASLHLISQSAQVLYAEVVVLWHLKSYVRYSSTHL